MKLRQFIEKRKQIEEEDRIKQLKNLEQEKEELVKKRERVLSACGVRNRSIGKLCLIQIIPQKGMLLRPLPWATDKEPRILNKTGFPNCRLNLMDLGLQVISFLLGHWTAAEFKAKDLTDLLKTAVVRKTERARKEAYPNKTWEMQDRESWVAVRSNNPQEFRDQAVFKKLSTQVGGHEPIELINLLCIFRIEYYPILRV